MRRSSAWSGILLQLLVLYTFASPVSSTPSHIPEMDARANARSVRCFTDYTTKKPAVWTRLATMMVTDTVTKRETITKTVAPRIPTSTRTVNEVETKVLKRTVEGDGELFSTTTTLHEFPEVTVTTYLTTRTPVTTISVLGEPTKEKTEAEPTEAIEDQDYEIETRAVHTQTTAKKGVTRYPVGVRCVQQATQTIRSTITTTAKGVRALATKTVSTTLTSTTTSTSTVLDAQAAITRTFTETERMDLTFTSTETKPSTQVATSTITDYYRPHITGKIELRAGDKDEVVGALRRTLSEEQVCQYGKGEGDELVVSFDRPSLGDDGKNVGIKVEGVVKPEMGPGLEWLSMVVERDSDLVVGGDTLLYLGLSVATEDGRNPMFKDNSYSRKIGKKRNVESLVWTVDQESLEVKGHWVNSDGERVRSVLMVKGKGSDRTLRVGPDVGAMEDAREVRFFIVPSEPAVVSS